ncbi:inovirus Gp2 family protein [Paraburkholderia sp. BCC1885]|uniref:inovirus Gp2 family protein n=1 Tax=Paraburkholderia sp. BCC1885 TaxID=2562669 RepID=UPI0021B4AED4|nr:inovirus Gp2 family protein [Paraburkholderia sp. BCC1885]
MTRPKLPTTIEPQTLDKIGRHLERNLNFFVGQDGRKIVGNGPEIMLLVKLDRFARLVLETDFAPFRIRGDMREVPLSNTDKFGGNRIVRPLRYTKTASPYSLSSGTEELAAIMRTFRAASKLFDTSNQAANQLLHAPHIRLLLDTFFHHRIGSYLGGNIELPIDFEGRIRADVYNDFVAQFRRTMRDSKSLRQEWRNWNLGSHENVANLSDYLDRLFANHGSLTVLHLRLFHARVRANLVTAPVEAQHRDLAALRACRALFFDRMRRKPALFTDDPGYVWAILPSLEGGYHLHLTLLFNTVALCRVVDDKRVEAEQFGVALQSHADQVGAYWVQMATDGRGSYLSGDANAALYGPGWVHGEVRADDPVRPEKLKETLGYLAMRRALVRLKSEPPGAYFGMPERKARVPRRLVRGGARSE